MPRWKQTCGMATFQNLAFPSPWEDTATSTSTITCRKDSRQRIMRGFFGRFGSRLLLVVFMISFFSDFWYYIRKPECIEWHKEDSNADLDRDPVTLVAGTLKDTSVFWVRYLGFELGESTSKALNLFFGLQNSMQSVHRGSVSHKESKSHEVMSVQVLFW